MTFLNPFVLFGLVAAAIPVILHLLNLRKLRTIEFSTLTFLKELQQTKIRRLKIRQILLLIVRTLLVILIVLAFARPALRGSLLGHIGTHAHSSVVFILDDSFSMKASDEYGELFAQAKESAVRLIDLLSEGDEAYFIKLSDLPQATVETPTHDIQALRTLVKESQVSTIRKPLDDALRLSAKLLSTSKNANKEVYIISDVQRTLFPTDLSNLQRKQSPLTSLFDENVKFFVVNTGKRNIANAAIDSVEVVTKILEKEKTATIYASIRNFSEAKLQNYVVSVFLDGAHTAQQSVQVQPWSSASVSFTTTPKRSGFIQGYIELERDVLEEDNKRYFTMYIPDRINVVLVSSSQADVKYPLLALQSGGGGLLKIQQTTTQQFSFIDLKSVDVVMLVGTKSLSANSIDRIKSFVERGGGIILLPSSDAQPNDFNTSFLSAFSIPPVENINNMPASQGSLSFQKIDFDHPLFATVFETSEKNKKQDQTSLESPIITTSLKRQTGKQNRTVISLSDGSPFLSEHTLGKGKILFYSVAPILSWSDFPLKGIFVPLLYRSALYVSSHEINQTSFITGDDFQLNLSLGTQSEQTSQLSLLSPDGVEELISRGNTSSKSKRLTFPGLYQVKSGTKLLSVVPVNVDSRESDDRKILSDELSEFWKRLGISSSSVQSLNHDDQLQTVVRQSRFGVELWKYCLGFALLLALIEMLIARDSKKDVQTGTLNTAAK